MNILAMGINIWGDHTHLALYHSQAGHEVKTLGPSNDDDYQYDPKETATQLVERLAPEWTPDIILCGCVELCPPPLEIELCPIKTVATVSDWNIYHPQLDYNLSRFDLVLIDKPGTQQLQLRGAPTLHFKPIYSYLENVHRPLDLTRDIDVLFLGSLNHGIHTKRAEALEIMAALSDDYHIVIAAGYPPDAYAEMMNRARIVLNYAVRGEMNLRCYEAPACGALLFLEDTNQEVRDFLTEDQEVVLYNHDNLAEKLAYYLQHQDEQERIAVAGQKRIQNLAPRHRLDDLFNWIQTQPKGTRGFNAFTAHDKSWANFFFYGMLLVPEHYDFLKLTVATLLRDAPDDPETHLAAACIAEAQEKTPTTKDSPRDTVLAHLKMAVKQAPDEAICWMNLAFVTKKAGNIPVEKQCLEFVLAANRADYGALLMGTLMDAYYAAWRLALAYGTATIQILQAHAAKRLAEIALEQERPEEALAHAKHSIALLPQIDAPYHLAGIAAHRLGKIELAVNFLEQGLPHTAFNADYRNDLITGLRVLGRLEDAQNCARESARLFNACPAQQALVAKFQDLSKT